MPAKAWATGMPLQGRAATAFSQGACSHFNPCPCSPLAGQQAIQLIRALNADAAGIYERLHMSYRPVGLVLS